MVTVVLALSSSQGISQQAAPTVLPITLEAKDIGALMQALGELPYKQAQPIADFIMRKEQEALNAAAAQKPGAPSPSKN